MILQGSQRGGAKDLAHHLLKDENDHVTVHELRGFISNDLVSALNEAQAISKGTRAKQFLFSLSLNPPQEENVPTQAFEDAIDRVEEKLGLAGQPRAVVFHEKQGRRHCHAVWSRIDTEEMKAIELPFTRYKLRDLSRELYIEHGWKMPPGYINSKASDPKNFTLEQWQQAKRVGKDPREIKAALQDSWAISDTQSAFQQALKDHGFTLARGDRRGFVALDHRCEIFAIPKWVGIKAKSVRSRLTDPDTLPSVQEAKDRIANEMTGRLDQLRKQQQETIQSRLSEIEEKRLNLAKQQAKERSQLEEQQEFRWQLETKQRQERFSKGLRGLLERVTGRYRELKEQTEQEALQAYRRDQQERDDLIFRHIEQRRSLQTRAERLQLFKEGHQQMLKCDIRQYQEVRQGKNTVANFKQRVQSGRSRNSLDRER